jgi:hypothetical protein
MPGRARTPRVPKRPSGIKVPKRPAAEPGGPARKAGSRAAVVGLLRQRLQPGGLPMKKTQSKARS